MRNLDYYLKEIIAMFGKKTVLAIASTMLLLLLCMALSTAFFVGREYETRLAGEANIAVFYETDLKLDELVYAIESIEDVISVEKVSEEQAYEEMKEFLGEERSLLERLGENPFDAYLKVRVRAEIDAEDLDRIAALPFVSHVRDNRAVLYKISEITTALAFAGVVIVAVSMLTLALIAYYVSAENILSKKELIDILKALKAPYSFIIRPFLWHGIIINLIAASLASGLFLFGMSVLHLKTDVSIPAVALIFSAAAVSIGILATMVSGKSVGKNHVF